MALIDMSQYDALEKDVKAAIRDNEVYSIHLSTVKKDLKKRKSGWTARVVILSIWAVVLVVAILLASGIVEFGGGAEAVNPDMVEGGSGETVQSGKEESGGIEWALVSMLFVPMTWSLCFVGFPIGWNMSKDDRQKAKNQIYVQHTVYEDGTVDTYESSLVPKLAAFFFSLFMGCLSMCFSVPVAIVQCFTWKGHIKRIEAIVKEIEGNPSLFVCD